MGFDLNTHVRGAKGNVVREQHYRLVIEQGVRRFERPVGSGIWYDEQGHIVMREQKTDAPSVASYESKELSDLKEMFAKQSAELEALKAQKPEPDTAAEAELPIAQAKRPEQKATKDAGTKA